MTRTDVEAALRISVVSAAWTLASGGVAIALGVARHTAVLVALGAIGFVDAVGSMTLAVHFRDALRNEALSERFERLAHAIVLVCLAAVGASSVVVGVTRLVRGDSGDGTTAGAVLAAASLGALIVLSLRKQRIAREVHSPALRSDGHLSGIGATQAAVALLGILATRLLSWTAADSVATAVVGAVAVLIAATTWLRARG